MRGWFWAFAGCTLIGTFAACSEGGAGNATSTGSGGSGGTGSGGAGSTTTGATTSGPGATTTAGTTAAGTTSSATSGGGTGNVIINEISAKSEDWVELANSGNGVADLSGYGLCDDDANGMCDLTTALHFPAGTTLAPGAYLLVVGNQMVDAGVGPFTTCLATGGPASCYYVTWKVSASKGESVHVLGPGDKVISEANYPANAVPTGQTWGRLPDLTGSFVANQPTPGAANKAP